MPLTAEMAGLRGGTPPGLPPAAALSVRLRRTVPGKLRPFRKLRTDCMLALPKPPLAGLPASSPAMPPHCSLSWVRPRLAKYGD